MRSIDVSRLTFQVHINFISLKSGLMEVEYDDAYSLMGLLTVL